MSSPGRITAAVRSPEAAPWPARLRVAHSTPRRPHWENEPASGPVPQQPRASSPSQTTPWKTAAETRTRSPDPATASARCTDYGPKDPAAHRSDESSHRLAHRLVDAATTHAAALREPTPPRALRDPVCPPSLPPLRSSEISGKRDPSTTRGSLSGYVSATLRIGEQAGEEDRNRGAGAQAHDRALALPRDGGRAGRSRAEG
jgi:hypothetical protein